MPARRIPRVLTIAGSDSGGGAGIQADLKAFAACGVHGMSAITAITAQNTVAVTAVHHIPPEVIIAQVRAVQHDIGIDAVKIGMLGTVATIDAVATALDELAPGTPVVLDPVMVAESGAELLEPSARSRLIELLLPRATVATPNIPEARALVASAREAAGEPPRRPGHRTGEQELARAVRSLGPAIVVVTGGHRDQADRHLLRRRTSGRAAGSALSERGRARLGMHALVRARSSVGPGDDPLTPPVAKELAAGAVRDGLETSAPAPGRSTSWDFRR